MDPLLLGGGISTAGNLISTGVNLWNQREGWRRQERLQSTAYQRAVADMRAAGLNPLMMYGGGSGGRPADSSVTSPAPVASGDMTHGIGEGVSSAARFSLERQRLENERKMTEAQVVKAQADAEAAKANAAKVVYETSQVLPASIDRVRSGIQLDLANRELSLASARNVGADAQKREFWERIYKKGNKVLDGLNLQLGRWASGEDPPEGRANRMFFNWLRGKWKSVSDFFSDGEGNANGGASSADAYKRAQDNMYRGKGR